MMKERWKELPGFPHYAISDRGRVISLSRTVPGDRGTVRHLRAKMLSIQANGMFGVSLEKSKIQFIYLPAVYRELFGKEPPRDCYPVKGYYLE
jgi:hypothetical protein